MGIGKLFQKSFYHSYEICLFMKIKIFKVAKELDPSITNYSSVKFSGASSFNLQVNVKLPINC